MGSEFTVRRYRTSDAGRVWTIHELALRASPLTFIDNAPVDDDLTNISKCYLDRDGEFLVGLVDDEIIATGGFQPHEDNTTEIRRVRVHPDYQHHGYGERLLKELEDHAREQGFSRIVLKTNEHLTAARRLYEKHGYEETHRETHLGTGDEFINYRKTIRRSR